MVITSSTGDARSEDGTGSARPIPQKVGRLVRDHDDRHGDGKRPSLGDVPAVGDVGESFRPVDVAYVPGGVGQVTAEAVDSLGRTPDHHLVGGGWRDD